MNMNNVNIISLLDDVIKIMDMEANLSSPAPIVTKNTLNIKYDKLPIKIPQPENPHAN